MLIFRVTCLQAIMLLLVLHAGGQNCFNTGVNGSVINLPCNAGCTPMKFKVPHLKSTSDYSIVNIAYDPFPFTTPASTEVTTIYSDDQFSIGYPLPFPFCFYDSLFTQFVIGSNGVVTFEMAQANCRNAWRLQSASVPQGIPFLGPQICSDLTGPKYSGYSIYSPYHDINPLITSTSPSRKIEWRVEGTAPCRKLIVTFYQIPLFGQNSQLNTSQVVMYESTGLIDIFIKDKTLVTGSSPWNDNLAILGLQKDAFTARPVPGKNATVWEEYNTGYRFVPSGPVSRFVKAELCDIGGTVLATTGMTPGADTATTTAGMLDLNFPDQCPSAASTQYIVKTYYASCSNPTQQMVSSDTITVNSTTSLEATVSTIPSACGPNGQITVDIPSGAGTLPYSLTLNGGAPVTTNNQTYTFTGLISGNYTVIITTSGGCAQTLVAHVGTSGVLSVQAIPAATSCAGAANGSITVNPQNGQAPFQYSINGNPYQGNNVFSGLMPGTYNIGVQDASGCVLTNYPVTVAQGPPLTATFTASPPACPGATNGSITVNPTSGLAPYQYSLNGNPVFQSSNVFSNLPSGSYFVTVKDAQNCSVNLGITVGASSGSLTATLTPTATSCAGMQNGTITINPTSGSGPYEYSLNGAPFTAGTLITGLAPGSYSVVVKDNAGCQSAPLPVTIAEGDPIQVNAVPLETSCPSAANGQITVNPVNGNGPFTYQIDSNPFQTGNIFTGLASGTYSVTVQDAAGCISAPVSVTVPAGAPLTGTAGSVNTSCAGAQDGTITATPTNGTAPFSYSLNGAPFQGSGIFTDLGAGSHSVVIQDAAGCVTQPIAVTVSAGPPLSATMNLVHTGCTGTSTGSATVNISSSGIFEYSLDGVNWQSGNTFTGLAAGNYIAYFQNTAGCSGSQSFSINDAAALQLTTSVQAVLCNGENNGQITASGSGGTAPYQYSLDGVSYQSSGNFNLPAGIYTVYIRDYNGCITTETVNISEPAPLTVSYSTQNATCDGGSNGQVVVTAGGGVGPYQYSLNGAAFQGSNIFNVISGTHNIVVRDANNCTYTTNVNIGLTNNLTLVQSPDITICQGSSGNLNVNSNATQYSWTPAAGLSSSSVKNPVASPSATTTYIVTATLGLCSARDTITVFVNPAPVPNAGAGATICFGQSYNLQGSGGVSYSWSGPSLSATNISNPVATPSQTAVYQLHVTGANGCSSLQPASVQVTVTPPIVVNVTNDTSVALGDQFQLFATSAGTIYSWSPASGLSDPSIPNPVVTVTGDIVYTVTATTPENCKGTATVIIRAYEGPELYVPNAFTPNGDGRNDLLVPFPVGIKQLNYFRIYNRWGEMIFSTNSLHRGWDGRINGVEQPTGSYVWVAEGIAGDGRKITWRGVVTLIR